MSKSTLTQKKPSTVSALPKGERWTPRKIHKSGVKFLLQNARAALFWDPGVGKTSTTLAALKILFEKGLINKVLLICPLSIAHSVWPGEIEKWADFHSLKAVVMHGKNREEALAQDAHIYITNFEGLTWLMEIETAPNERNPRKKHVSINKDKFKSYGFDVLVIDELSRFKNHAGVRFKAMKEVLKYFSRTIGLTGSPAANGLEGLFGQCYILDEGRTLGRYISHYRNEYFVPDRSGFGWVLRAGAENEIYDRIRPLVHRASAEDTVDMPGLVKNIIKVDLPPKKMELYKALDKDFIVAVDKKLITASTAAVKGGKLRQFANGAVYETIEVDPEADIVTKPTKREWALVHDEKINALDALVDELQGNQLLVAYEFKHDEERLRKAFPKAQFVADWPGAKLRDFEKKWNAGEFSLAFGNPMSMGHGLNLQQRCHHAALFSIPWDYEIVDQYIRRVYRQGNKAGTVFIHYLVARGTSDERVMDVLMQKKATQEQLFKAVMRRK